MASNALPSNKGDLIKLGNKMANGLTALGQSLGIIQVTAASLNTQLAAVTANEAGFNQARDARQIASTACTAIHDNIAKWLLKAKTVLVPYLGSTWSAAWAAAGFIDHSTAVPKYVGDQLKLVELLALYFTANPSYEDPAVGVTAAAATALKDNSKSANAIFNAAQTAAITAKEARETAIADLTDSMRMLIRILDGLLYGNDPRWATFGLNQPDANTTPAAPANLVARLSSEAAILLECDPVPLATRYRWRMKVVGAETTFSLAASTKSPLAQITSALPGRTVEIFVQAANESSQSLPSASVVVTLPPVAVTAQPPAVAVHAPADKVLAPAGFTNISNGETHSRRATATASRKGAANGNGH